jgi:hypothetical protein
MMNAGAGMIAVPVKIDGRMTIPIIAVQNAAMAKSGARGRAACTALFRYFPYHKLQCDN